MIAKVKTAVVGSSELIVQHIKNMERNFELCWKFMLDCFFYEVCMRCSVVASFLKSYLIVYVFLLPLVVLLSC